MRDIIVALSNEAITQEVDGETVILDLNSEQYFSLDEVGTRVWQLLAEHGQVEKVIELMLQEFEVTPEQLRADLGALLKSLEDAGLISQSVEGE